MSDGAVKLSSVGDPTRPALVLVHGWGHHSGVWQTLLDELQAHFFVFCVDLPGYGQPIGSTSPTAELENEWRLEALLETCAALPVPAAIWCGWSLGGMLATRFAAFAPERVRALVTIAANPVFVEKTDWPTAMPATDYAEFVAALNNDAEATLKRFLSLVSQGSATARAERRWLKQVIAKAALPDQLTLQASLDLLASMDTRGAIASITLPQSHLLGAQDALVPAGAAEMIGELNQQASIQLIDGAGHALFLSHPQTVVTTLIKMAAVL